MVCGMCKPLPKVMPTDPVLRARAEIAQFENARTRYAQRIACVPSQAQEPIEAGRLLALSGS